MREIIDNSRVRAEEAERNISGVEARKFSERVEEKKGRGEVPVISELKPTSPTTPGEKHRDPGEVAREMVEGGAVALSVLTEPYHFGGSLEYLKEVRDAVDVPVLRKDFVLNETQLYEVEADMVLLIAEFLDDLAGMVEKASALGFQPVVEIHTENQLKTALGTGADVVGVNNRDLTELEVDLDVCEHLLPEIPDDRTAVAESGISTVDDAARMVDAGADALLVGTSIMQSDDVEGKTRELVNSVD
ncbi:MAG: indole-3-glycerol-phosphate synthase [Halobacteria archaeon]